MNILKNVLIVIFILIIIIGIGINLAGFFQTKTEEVLIDPQESLKELIDDNTEEGGDEVNLDSSINKVLETGFKSTKVDDQTSQSQPIEDKAKNMNIKNLNVVMETNFGDIKLELFLKEAPKTVKNFLDLTQKGFYNKTKFHRVIKGFMIQGGDPNSKDDDWSNDGQGGPGYKFADEIHADNKNMIGTLSMANSGPDTNGSQFFINTANNNFLDTKHTVFGRVIDGLDVITKIENVKVDKAKGDHPIDDVIVKEIRLVPIEP